MGSTSSTVQSGENSESLKGLLPEPFRKLNEGGEDFCEDFKMKLLKKVLEKRPPEGVQYFNILLLGQAASGKSSFFNTLSTAIVNEGRILAPFAVLESSTSSTTVKLQTQPLVSSKSHPLPIRILDCRGLHKTTGIQTNDLESLVDGNIKPFYTFNTVEPISKESKFYRPEPELKDKIHCLVYVAKADNPAEALTDSETKQQFDIIRSKLSKANVPQMALLNMIDRVGDGKLEDLFLSKSVEEVCDAARGYLSLPVNTILPMSCYFHESSPNTVKDTLALYNLNAMLDRANDYLLAELKTHTPEDFYE